MFRAVLVTALLAGAALPAGPSLARGQALDAAALVGYGFDHVYRAGLGARVGVELPVPIAAMDAGALYLGVGGVYHLGSSSTARLPNGFLAQGEARAGYLGGEVGLVWPSEKIVVRATGLVGLAAITGDVSAGGGLVLGTEKRTVGKLLVSPGLVFSVPMGDARVGAELRYLGVSGFGSLAAYLGVGFRH